MKGKLGDYVELVRKQNKDLITDTLVGVDINKNLIENKVKGKKTDLRTLQIVEKGCFVMSGMNTGRDRRVALALYMGDRPLGASGSNKYYVFRVKDPNLKTEYLNLILKAEKIDQIGLYLSGKGVRGELEWKNFSQIAITFPELAIQERIVNKYQAVAKYIVVKKKINELLEKQMKAYFHILFDNLKDYEIKGFGELFTVIGGGRPPRSNRWLEELYFCKSEGIPWLQVIDIAKSNFKFINKTTDQLTEEGFKRGRCTLLGGGNLIIVKDASRNSIGKVFITSRPMCFDSHLWALKHNKEIGLPFLFFFLKNHVPEWVRLADSSSTSKRNLKISKLLPLEFKIPLKQLLNQFNSFCEPIFELQKNNEQIIQKLLRLQKCWVESLE